jgi:hypothetical protein
LRLQCGMPSSKLEVSTVQPGTLSGAGYLHQSLHVHVRSTLRKRQGIVEGQEGSSTGNWWKMRINAALSAF